MVDVEDMLNAAKRDRLSQTVLVSDGLKFCRGPSLKPRSEGNGAEQTRKAEEQPKEHGEDINPPPRRCR